MPLSEFSDRALGVRAPLVSDRCTVFMERDLNRFLNKKYSVNELLAASLFAVRENYLLKVATEGNIGNHICFQGSTAKNRALAAIEFLEKKYFVHFEKFIGKPVTGNPEFADIFSRFNMRLEQGGESWENILKIFHILKVHPDISLFVQTNPAFCCPALVTEAQSRDIQRITGVPIVTLTYDGTGTPINDCLIPYLKYPRTTTPRNAN